MNRDAEIMVTLPAVEHRQSAQTTQELFEAAEKMLFIAPIGLQGTVQYAAWTQLRAALDQVKPFIEAGR